MNFIVQISSECGQGGRGSKNPTMSLMDAPKQERRRFSVGFEAEADLFDWGKGGDVSDVRGEGGDKAIDRSGEIAKGVRHSPLRLLSLSSD